jgi:hypothetical protein
VLQVRPFRRHGDTDPAKPPRLLDSTHRPGRQDQATFALLAAVKKNPSGSKRLVVCLTNTNFAASLELRKIYPCLGKVKVGANTLLRIVDESQMPWGQAYIIHFRARGGSPREAGGRKALPYGTRGTMAVAGGGRARGPPLRREGARREGPGVTHR